jgi:hypothetical protein
VNLKLRLEYDIRENLIETGYESTACVRLVEDGDQ